MCGVEIRILKYEKWPKKKQRETKEKTNLSHCKLQETQIAVFVYDWLIR